MATQVLYATQPGGSIPPAPPAGNRERILDGAVSVAAGVVGAAGSALSGALPASTGVWSPAQLEAEYTYYEIHTSYSTDLGLVVSPMTAASVTTTQSGSQAPPVTTQNPDENMIVRTRRPCTIKTVSWSAQRLFIKPLLPHWNTGNANEKLLSRTISARNPLQSHQHKIWEVSGVYVYAFKKEPFVTVNSTEYFILPAGISPAENLAIGVATQSYCQGDFGFVPTNTSWIPLRPALDTPLPVGFRARTGTPDVDRVTMETTIRGGG
jgi:hypothetical protein